MGVKKTSPFSRRKGLSVTAFLSPSLAVLLSLHVLIAAFIIEINRASVFLSDSMQRSASYVTDATSLLAGSSLLSETSTNFVLRPVLDDKSPNVGPMIAYCNELRIPRRGDDIVNRFANTDADAEAKAHLQTAAESANYMYRIQLRSLSLITSVYPLPPLEQLSTLQLPALSPEDSALNVEEKVSLAANLMLDVEYGNHKGAVSTHVNAAVGILRSVSEQHSASTNRKIGILRTWLWIGTISVVVLILFIFSVLYRSMIIPVVRSSKLIEKDEKLEFEHSFREVRTLSASYNELKDRRDALDKMLRLAAERDALTGLANRYAYEQMLDALAMHQGSDTSVAFFLFDLNFLKETNDHFGHAAGDAALKETAYCIAQCFTGGKHFRIGGDEFAAILMGVDEDKIQQMVKDFLQMQQEKDISVSYGYSYAASLARGDIEDLTKTADSAMYECKAKMHEERPINL
ncbi:MAG: diguanylate cyclase [Bacilli bacterium]|nr:diguanylate cyclase [Bacilli bacterium]